MTLDDFVLKTLGNRIKWLHGLEGPRGKLSHDRFAEELVRLGAPATTSRQTVINWENGTEPKEEAVRALVAFSGFPNEAFSRAGAEVLVEELSRPRLQALEERAVGAVLTFQAVLAALAANGIQVPLPQEAVGFLATGTSTIQGNP